MRPRLAAGLLAAATVSYAAHNVTVIANATNIAYSGNANNWQTYTNCGGTKYTFDEGNFFNFNFFGTGVYVVGTASLEGGIITFNLDGVSSTFDRYSPPPYRCGIMFFAKGGLENTSHSLTATLSGASPANMTGDTFFEFQWIQYTQLDPGETPATTTVSSTSSSSRSSSSSTATSPPSTGGSNAAAIGGGIAAGAVGLLIIALVIWYFMRRQKPTPARSKSLKPDLDGTGPPSDFIYSPVGATTNYGRNSHDYSAAASDERRRSMSNAPNPGIARTASPWASEARPVSGMGPMSDSSAGHYPPGAAPPLAVHATGSQSGSSGSKSYSSIRSPGSNFTVTNSTGSSVPLAALPESDVDRIAVRVAAMMAQQQQQTQQAPSMGLVPPLKSGDQQVQQMIQTAYDEQPPPQYEPTRK